MSYRKGRQRDVRGRRKMKWIREGTRERRITEEREEKTIGLWEVGRGR